MRKLDPSIGKKVINSNYLRGTPANELTRKDFKSVSLNSEMLFSHIRSEVPKHTKTQMDL